MKFNCNICLWFVNVILLPCFIVNQKVSIQRIIFNQYSSISLLMFIRYRWILDSLLFWYVIKEIKKNIMKPKSQKSFAVATLHNAMFYALIIGQALTYLIHYQYSVLKHEQYDGFGRFYSYNYWYIVRERSAIDIVMNITKIKLQNRTLSRV